MRSIGFGLALVVLLLACSRGERATSAETAVERGRRAYRSVCTACHHADPSQDGSVGPAVAGASRALLEAKVLRGTYPPGYTPKRSTQAMPRYEQLAPFLDDLAAYLASAAQSSPSATR